MTNPDRFSSAATLQEGDVPAVVASVRRNGADSSSAAILVGNRAGIAEWANGAWTRITGLSVPETIGKPISHFLGLAGIELEVVDFVGRHFLEGRSCLIEFPFETPDRHVVRICLEVQPIRDPGGEPATFLAIANVIDDPCPSGATPASEGSDDVTACCRRASPIPVSSSPRQATRALPGTMGDRVDLSAIARRALSGYLPRIAPRTTIDAYLEDGLPPVEARADLLQRLVSRLIGNACHAIGSDWGTLTLVAGRTTGGRSHVSRVHPVTARLPEPVARPSIYLEVHDSAASPSHGVVATARPGGLDARPRTSLLVEAERLALRLGATLHFQSTPGCGNQVLVLFPLGFRSASAEGGTIL